MTPDLQELRIKQYTISPELYRSGYRGDRGPCACTAVCCHEGVYVDVKERDRLLLHRMLIKNYMDESQTKDDTLWFEPSEEPDSDFESGRCVGTQVINGKCAFLDKFGRCSVQVAAADIGMNKWALKPFFCILFPLEVSNNVIRFDDLLDEEQACCTIGAEFDVPLFRACKEELIHILGQDGYDELEAFYEKNHVALAKKDLRKEVA